MLSSKQCRDTGACIASQKYCHCEPSANCTTPVIANGQADAVTTIFRALENTTIQCNPGFELEDPTKNGLQCSIDGEWNVTEPQCLPNILTKYSKLADGDSTTCITINSSEPISITLEPRRVSSIKIIGKELICNPTDGQFLIYNEYSSDTGCDGCVPFASPNEQNRECNYKCHTKMLKWFIIHITPTEESPIVSVCEILIN